MVFAFYVEKKRNPVQSDSLFFWKLPSGNNRVTVGAVFLIALVVLSTCFGFVLFMVSSVWSGLNSNLVLESCSAQIHRSSYKWWAEVKQSDCLNICAGLTGKREKKGNVRSEICVTDSVSSDCHWLSTEFNYRVLKRLRCCWLAAPLIGIYVFVVVVRKKSFVKDLLDHHFYFPALREAREAELHPEVVCRGTQTTLWSMIRTLVEQRPGSVCTDEGLSVTRSIQPGLVDPICFLDIFS